LSTRQAPSVGCVARIGAEVAGVPTITGITTGHGDTYPFKSTSVTIGGWWFALRRGVSGLSQVELGASVHTTGITPGTTSRLDCGGGRCINGRLITWSTGRDGNTRCVPQLGLTDRFVRAPH